MNFRHKIIFTNEGANICDKYLLGILSMSFFRARGSCRKNCIIIGQDLQEMYIARIFFFFKSLEKKISNREREREIANIRL